LSYCPFQPRGFVPRTPLHAPWLAPSPARSGRVARFATLARADSTITNEQCDRHSTFANRQLFRLAMPRVFAAEAAVLVELEPLARFLLVLGRAVVAPLALVARQRDDVTHVFGDRGRRFASSPPAPRLGSLHSLAAPTARSVPLALSNPMSTR